MKRIRSLTESGFLKLFFYFIAISFLVAAVCMRDRSSMFTGLWKILSTPCKVPTNYFAVGGFAATFLNMGLLSWICLALFHIFDTKVNSVSNLAFLLTAGFGSWGINILNIWPTIAGVLLYAAVKKEKPGQLVHAMLFSTGIAPLITELMVRYPGTDSVGFRLGGVVLAIAVGLVTGFFLPAGLLHSPKVHKGFSLYSAAVPVGMTALLLNAVLYKTMGLDVNAFSPMGDLSVAAPTAVNIFCCAIFGSCIVFALLLGCRPRDYWKLLTGPEPVSSFTETYGNAVFLMNAGLFGLCILAYCNLIGAEFNGVTFGVMFCMVACSNSGSHPGNLWPILLGYGAASLVFGWLSTLVGGDFAGQLNNQFIVVGLCYANGLTPISDRYGWYHGFLASVFHYCMVTTVPSLHGGFCLYNGGLTAALVCLLLVPPMERLLKTKQERRLKT